MYVLDTEPGEAADRAHIRAGDWIQSVGGARKNSQTRTCETLASEAGGSVRVKGYRFLSTRSFGSLLSSLVGTGFNRTMKVPE